MPDVSVAIIAPCLVTSTSRLGVLPVTSSFHGNRTTRGYWLVCEIVLQNSIVRSQTQQVFSKIIGGSMNRQRNGRTETKSHAVTREDNWDQFRKCSVQYYLLMEWGKGGPFGLPHHASVAGW